MMKNILYTAINAALEAGKVTLEIYYEGNDFDIELKDRDNSPVTKADKASHNVILSYLSETKIPILSEESKNIAYKERKDWKQLWIVDPIDGTKEFIKRNGEFTVNIALIENQKPTLGVIFVPAKGLLYFSSIDLGAFKVDVNLKLYNVESLIDRARKIIRKGDNDIFTVVVSKSHLTKKTQKHIKKIKNKHIEINLISIGSSLKFCLVAEGAANCYPRFAPTMEWDTAAGQAICEHSGLTVLDWNTKQPILYNKKKLVNNFFLVQ